MKKILTISTLISIAFIGNSQSISISYLQIAAKTNAIVPLINTWRGPDVTDSSYKLSYEQFLKNKKNSLSLFYSKLEGCTVFYFERGGYIAGGGEVLGKGFCGGVNIHRFDLVFSRLLTKYGKKIYFKPFGGAGFQLSRTTGKEYWATGLPINGPSYFELEPVTAESRNTDQIVPVLGLSTGFVFWKRIDIGLFIQGVYAFKPYQKMTIKYQYKGEVQPTAIYESTGTGLFFGLSLGYRFARLIK